MFIILFYSFAMFKTARMLNLYESAFERRSRYDLRGLVITSTLEVTFHVAFFDLCLVDAFVASVHEVCCIYEA